MNEYEEKLRAFINANSIDAQLLVFETSCHSVEEAARSAKATPEEFVKNICLVDDENGHKNEFIVAIIPGIRRVDVKKVGTILGSKRVRFADSEEILERTGYPAGGTPSFGYKARFFIDNLVMDKEVVYSGGGSQKALTKVSPKEIVRINNAIVEDLSK
ncbi:YbaK/EbsC family protein [Candidatus Micrarchaeota archaeon]|nr:YbaK/EbsC family protein [Candidatus Micrarchaeota archaeon]